MQWIAHLEAVGVGESDHVLEFLNALFVGLAGDDQAAVAATDVSLAHPGRPVGRDPVGEDLDAADLQLLVAEAGMEAETGAARP